MFPTPYLDAFLKWLSHFKFDGGFNGVWDQRKLVIFVVMVVFLAPLCSLDKIDSLSLTSAASVALAILFVLVTFTVAFIKLVEGRIDAPRMAPDFSSKTAILDLLVVIPIMTSKSKMAMKRM